MAAEVVKLDGKEVKTLQGTPVAIEFDGNAVKIGNAKVTKTDIETSNGVIHVIDTVLLPPADTNKAKAAPSQGQTFVTPSPARYATPVIMIYVAPVAPACAAPWHTRLFRRGMGRAVTTWCGR